MANRKNEDWSENLYRPDYDEDWGNAWRESPDYAGAESGGEYAPYGYYERAWGRGFNTRGEYHARSDEQYHTSPFAGRGPRGYQRRDERILDEVNERLSRHGRLDASQIAVEVHDREVTLNGSVPDRRMKRLAEDLAYSATQVRDVHNNLLVRPAEGQPGAGSYCQGPGRQDFVGHTGVYPASAQEAPQDAQAQGMASWGQGERGAAGYEDHGDSEIHPEGS